MPIYYLSDNTEINCNTGETNRCRFLYRLEEGVPTTIKIRFFAFNPFKNEEDVFVFANEINDQELYENNNLSWEHFFSYNDERTLDSEQHLNTFWGRSYGRGSNLFITVEAMVNHKEFKFSTIHIERFCEKKLNLLPYSGRGYKVISNEVITSLIPYIPKEESIKKYQLVMNYRAVFLPYNFSVFDINVYSSHFIHIVNLDNLNPINIPIVGANFEVMLQYWISMKKNVFLTDLNLYTINTLYLNHSLPWEIAYKLGTHENNFTLNIMINRNTKTQFFFNYSNYEIEAYYVDSEFIDKRNKGESINRKYLKAEKASLNNDQIIILNFLIDEEKRKLFDYIYLKIIEILPSSNSMENNNIILTIRGVTYPEKLSSTPIYHLHYLFNYFSKERSNVHYYLIANPITQSELIKEFDFASCFCSGDFYQVSFSFENGTILSEEQIKLRYEKNGIRKYRMHNEIGISHIIVTIRINNISEASSNEQWFYGIKFLLYEKILEDELRVYKIEKQLFSNYNKNTKKIESKWGTIVNQHNKVPENLKFFYYIFENNTSTSLQTICFPYKPVYQKVLFEYLNDFYINEAFEYKSHLIGYFIDEVNEEIFVSYVPQDVTNYLSSIWIWIVILFFFLFGGFIAASYYLYREILKRKQEIEESPLMIEIDKTNNR